jgi:hypothetical protein
MQRVKKKIMHCGYALRINRTGETGNENWQHVGNFPSRESARQYRLRYYPKAAKSTITGIRVDATPLVVTTRNNEEKEASQ